MAIVICTWKWGTKYAPFYVDRLAEGIRKHFRTPHQFRVFSPCEEDMYLTNIQGCFARLRMFSSKWQKEQGINRDDVLICMDLDLIITRKLDLLFDRHEPFVILGGANSVNPCPYNGSLMLLRGGHHHQIWDDFSITATRSIKFHEFPDDQGWIWHKLGDRVPTWPCGQYSGIYAFRKRTWPQGDQLPQDAKIVCFPGRQDPSNFQHLPWIRKHWTSLA